MGQVRWARYVDKDTVIVGVVEDVAIEPGLDPTAPLSAEESYVYPRDAGGCSAPVTAPRLVPAQLDRPHLWPGRRVDGADAARARERRSQPAFLRLLQDEDLLAKTLATQRVEVALLSTMAVLALLLSAVGIFALVANVITQKTREIGIRMALGSTVRQAMVNMGSPGVRASGLGLILGLVLCAGALRAMRSVLYGVGIYDTTTILCVILILASVTIIAGTVPTLRIARIDPAQTLRDE